MVQIFFHISLKSQSFIHHSVYSYGVLWVLLTMM